MSSKTSSRFWQYVDDVIDGKILVGKYVRLAVERFIRDRDRKDFVFDEKAGWKVVDFTEKFCHHWKGFYAGKPVILLPHQVFYTVNLFGWKNEDGTRRFRRSYKEIARKQGKTTEAATKALYLISKDGEQGAQIFSGATKEDQARLVVNDAGKIVEASPKLRGKFQLFKYKESISRVVYPGTNSFIKPLGKDSDRQDGTDPSSAIIDEYHAHNDDGIVNVLQSGMAMRTQPLMDIITTAGFNMDGPCYRFRKVCTEVLEGVKQDDALLAMIFSLDEGDSWEDPEVWIKAVPNLSDPVLKEKALMPYLLQRYHEAKNEAASKEVDFRTRNLNQWVDSPTVWIPDDVYMRNTRGLAPDSLDGELCYGGLDLASGIDLNAFVLFFPETNAIKCWFWLPEDNVVNNRNKIDYRDWVRSGFIFTTPGNVIDFSYISTFIIEETRKYRMEVLAYDPRLALTGPIPALLDAGIDCQPFGQGIMNVSNTTKEIERLLYSGQMEHFNNPVLRWMFSCVTLRRDSNNNIAVDKGKSTGKIDGVSALVDAVGASQKWPPQESVYKHRGVLTL